MMIQNTEVRRDNARRALLELMKAMAGQQGSLHIPVPFIALCKGDHIAALLFNQILYWTERTKDNGGWFPKSYTEWYGELYISESQVKRVINGDKRSKNTFNLRLLGVETQLKKSRFHQFAPTLHYRVNLDVLMEYILDNEDVWVLDNVQNSIPNNVQNQIPNNVQNEPPAMLGILYTETITEISTETIQKEKDYVVPEGTTPAPVLVDEPVVQVTPLDSDQVEQPLPDAPKSGKKPKARKSAVHAPIAQAIMSAFGVRETSLTPSAARQYYIVAAELAGAGYTLEDIEPLYKFVAEMAQRGNWTSWGVHSLSKYAGNYRAKHPTPPPKIEIVPDYTFFDEMNASIAERAKTIDVSDGFDFEAAAAEALRQMDERLPAIKSGRWKPHGTE